MVSADWTQAPIPLLTSGNPLTGPYTISATPRYQTAIRDLVSLLTALRSPYAFVGTVAAAAWLGEEVSSGPLDLLATVGGDRSGHLPMMAGNRGFEVDRAEVEAAEELDLVPMTHPGDPRVRVHVLLASNALYGTMVRDCAVTQFEGEDIRVITVEDYALLLLMGDEESQGRSVAVRRRKDFDISRFNEKLISIGLGERTGAE